MRDDIEDLRMRDFSPPLKNKWFEERKHIMNKTICYYHNDPDGWMSAAIVCSANHNLKLYPVSYDIPIDTTCICPEDTVYMVDFAPSDFKIMRTIFDSCKKFIWIDHHKTSIERYEEYLKENPALEGIRDTNFAGCQLTWSFIYPQKEVPTSVLYVGLWDTWKWQHNPIIESFVAGLKDFAYKNPLKDYAESRDSMKLSMSDWAILVQPNLDDAFRTKFDEETASRLLTMYNNKNHILMEYIIENGEEIVLYRKNRDAKLAKELCFEAKLGDYEVIAANTSIRVSSFFDSVIPKFPNAKFAVAFSYSNNYWSFSIYEIPGKDYSNILSNCADIAKTYGGGGHKGAAGFQIYSMNIPLTIDTDCPK